MTINLISMLTWKDKTVENALDIFENCKYISNAVCWGFKDCLF